MNTKTWDRIKYYREKYKNTPNGWALALMIGSEYNSEEYNYSASRRRKNRNRKRKTT